MSQVTHVFPEQSIVMTTVKKESVETYTSVPSQHSLCPGFHHPWPVQARHSPHPFPPGPLDPQICSPPSTLPPCPPSQPQLIRPIPPKTPKQPCPPAFQWTGSLLCQHTCAGGKVKDHQALMVLHLASCKFVSLFSPSPVQANFFQKTSIFPPKST